MDGQGSLETTWKVRKRSENLKIDDYARQSSEHLSILFKLIDWLVWVKRPFETVFQSISGRLPKRGRKRKERVDESKMSKQPPPAPTASAIGPCPIVIQIVGAPALEVYPAPSHHPTTHFCSRGERMYILMR